MSTIIMARVWPLSMDPSRKAVLVSLADQSNDRGYCWPSVGTIAMRTCFDERTVRRALNELMDAGYVVKQLRTGKSSLFKVVPNPGSDEVSPEEVGEASSIAAAITAIETTEEVMRRNRLQTPVTVSPPQTPVTVSPPPVTVSPPPVTVSPPPLTPCPPNRKLNRQGTNMNQEKEPAARRATGLPDGFGVSERVARWAAEKGHRNLDRHLEHFLGYVRANGKRYIEWDEALMNAIRGNWARLPVVASTAARRERGVAL